MIALDVSRLDTKQTEIARTLLCDDRLIRLGTDPSGVPVVLKPLDDVDMQIVIDVDDRVLLIDDNATVTAQLPARTTRCDCDGYLRLTTT